MQVTYLAIIKPTKPQEASSFSFPDLTPPGAQNEKPPCVPTVRFYGHLKITYNGRSPYVPCIIHGVSISGNRTPTAGHFYVPRYHEYLFD